MRILISATSVGFDVDSEQRIWFTCAYRKDGFQAEFLKLKMTEFGLD
jgi:hypothetical protein|tara:strand:+ start:229 stop:369 length:141 start_codon:yes stop_codon:yes gene_type:complete